MDPFVRKSLHEFLYSYDPTAFDRIGRGQGGSVGLDPLLASSRMVLVSVTEVEFQNLWSEFYMAISLDGGTTVADLNHWDAYIDFFQSDMLRLLRRYVPATICHHSCNHVHIYYSETRR